jgi:hypothetical protein
LVQEKQLLAGEEASAALRRELSVARAELERERSEKEISVNEVANLRRELLSLAENPADLLKVRCWLLTAADLFSFLSELGRFQMAVYWIMSIRENSRIVLWRDSSIEVYGADRTDHEPERQAIAVYSEVRAEGLEL